MRIGDLELSGNVVLAPMAGITDPPFRRIVQRFGVSAVWTEMMSADGLVQGKTFRTMELTGHTVPTVFQIYGKDPGTMGEAARILQDEGAAAIDLNMGCPAQKVVRHGAGAALMKNPVLVGRIVATVRRLLGIPLTVKIRSGWDEATTNAPGLAKVVEGEGADAVIVHARTRSRGHSGPVSLSLLAEVKQAVGIPVIGNGGIKSHDDALSTVRGTGCDALMIGRGALGRPWLPGRILGRLRFRPNLPQRELSLFEVIRDHYLDLLSWADPLTAVGKMGRHLGWYSKGLPGAARFRQTVLLLEDPARVMESIEGFFGELVVQ